MTNSEIQNYEEALWALAGLDQPPPESCYALSIGPDSPKETKKGRPKTFRNQNFIRITHNSFKIDNLRTKLIRGLNKAIRAIFKYHKSTSVQRRYLDQSLFIDHNRKRPIIHLLDPAKHSDRLQRMNLVSFIGEDIQYFKIKSQFMNDIPNIRFRSYNENFCIELFREDKMKECLRLYLNLVFNDRSPDDYIHRFNMSCCDSEHNGRCFDIWDSLRNHIESILLNN